MASSPVRQELAGRVSLRLVGPNDEALLRAIYASTRKEELDQVDWDASQKEAFLRMQFNAQHNFYGSQYPAMESLIIVVDGGDVGRLYINRTPEEIHIVDIALLAQYRKCGVGSYLLSQILDEAQRASRKVTIHVEQFNPALRLYQRFGFVPIAEQGVYYLMARPYTPDVP